MTADPFKPQLVDVDDELLADVVQQGLFAADDAIFNGGPHRTRAEETRAAVTAAFRLAARNGLITLAPRESWPEWIALDASPGGVVTLFDDAPVPPPQPAPPPRPHIAARLSKILFSAREFLDMYADVVEANVHRTDRNLRRLIAEIDEFRREQGWGPQTDGYVGFGDEPDVGISDGDHTHADLYAHRVTLFAALARSRPELAWRSRHHHDGTMFAGWFIAGMQLPTGQVTYHAPLDAWDEFERVATLPTAPEWDGHNAEQVLDRLRRWRPGEARLT